jgi:hypothetical protein
MKADELDCMDTYSGNTIVTLTATGWLHIAQEALLELEQASDKKQSAQFQCNAQRSLRRALVAIDEDRPRRRQTVNGLPVSLAVAKKRSH